MPLDAVLCRARAVDPFVVDPGLEHYFDMSKAERAVSGRRIELGDDFIFARADCNFAYDRLRRTLTQYTASGRAEAFDALRAQMDRLRGPVNRAADETIERMVEEAENDVELWDHLATFAGRPNTRGGWAEATDSQAHAEDHRAETAAGAHPNGNLVRRRPPTQRLRQVVAACERRPPRSRRPPARA